MNKKWSAIGLKVENHLKRMGFDWYDTKM
jgi:hypothetical protein